MTFFDSVAAVKAVKPRRSQQTTESSMVCSSVALFSPLRATSCATCGERNFDMKCARWPWITWYCTLPTRKISRPTAVATGATVFGSTMPEAMKGAAAAKASRRSDSARSGRRRSISRPEKSDSSSPSVSGSANIQNSGSRAMKTSWKPALRKFSTRVRGNRQAISR